jgi:hypothetical protein
VGDAFDARSRLLDGEETDDALEALTRIHARACLTAGEVQALLEAGFASGAWARWRSLHELAVTASFVRKHGLPAGSRYLAHDRLQAYTAARSRRDHGAGLGHEPMPDEALEAAKRHRDELVAEFGPPIQGEYGWAAEALGKRVNFSMIERDVEFEPWRAPYRTANGSERSAGDPESPPGRRGVDRSGLLGLADPGDATCVSLLQAATCLLTYKVDPDNLAILALLMALQPEVRQAFEDARMRGEALDREPRGDSGD